MDYAQLIEEVTRLVIEELKKINNTPSSSYLVLIDEEMDNFEGLLDVLTKISGGASFTFVLNQNQKEDVAQIFKDAHFIVTPPRGDFKKIASKFSKVIVPYLSITSLVKITSLLGDEPLTGILLHSLILGVPTFVCTDYILSIKYQNPNAPRKILNKVSSLLEELKSMGVELVQLESLPEKSKREAISVETESNIGFKHVVTNEDILVAVEQKIEVLNFPRGTIITPLARQTAQQYGIEINIV